MASSDLIRRDPQWVTNDASGIEFTASHEDAAQNRPTRSPILPGEPWRESQWRQAIEEIVGGITRLPHLRRHHHDVRDVVGLPAACRSYNQQVEEILNLMYEYLEIRQHHGGRNRHSWIPHIIENLRQSENPLVSILGRGEEYQFLRDSRMFRNSPRYPLVSILARGEEYQFLRDTRMFRISPRYYVSSFTNAGITFLQKFCNGNLPERLESALGVAITCIKVDAECRHTGAEPLAVQNVEDMSSEVCGQMLYFHYCRKSSVQARQESRIEELEATVNNMLTVEDDLRAQNARLLDSLRTAKQQAATAENQLRAERTLRQRAHASRGRAFRQAEHRLRDDYARQHDEWYHDLRNYRADREQYRLAFQASVEAPGRASGHDRSWLDLRRETNELFTDLETANDAQANLEADFSRVRGQRNHACRGRDNAQGQLHHALRERDDLQGQLHHALRERDDLQGELHHALRERDDLQGELHHALRERDNVRGQLHYALRERDDLQDQLRHAQAYRNPYYHQIGRPRPR